LIQIQIIHLLFLIVNLQEILFDFKLKIFLIVLELNLPDTDELKAIGINTKQRLVLFIDN